MKIIATLVTGLIFYFLTVDVVLADDCSRVRGSLGPHSYLYNSSGGFTGRDCNALRMGSGSNVGPGQFSDVYTCVGSAGCIIQISYCAVVAPGTADEKHCEESYTEVNCSKAPAACNKPNAPADTDISKVFGRIVPPPAIADFGFGAAGISKFLTNLIALIYILAAIVLIFMLLWGAFDWITSGGDKEKVHAARERITQAFVGIILFAAAFAVIAVLGQFTGFKFFVGQP